jgi:hypothetical protein
MDRHSRSELHDYRASHRDAANLVRRALDSPGAALEHGARAHLESRFGHDFGRVRVFADAPAQRAAAALNARAFAVGSDVVFGRGQYAPATQPGRLLLAHELAHVVQTGGIAPSSLVCRSDGAVEADADRAATNAEGLPRRASARPALRAPGGIRLKHEHGSVPGAVLAPAVRRGGRPVERPDVRARLDPARPAPAARAPLRLRASDMTPLPRCPRW